MVIVPKTKGANMGDKYSVKAQGFEKLTMRHARTKHWRQFFSGPMGRLIRQSPNTDVCHACHDKQSGGATMYQIEGHLLCYGCYGKYVTGLVSRGITPRQAQAVKVRVA